MKYEFFLMNFVALSEIADINKCTVSLSQTESSQIHVSGYTVQIVLSILQNMHRLQEQSKVSKRKLDQGDDDGAECWQIPANATKILKLVTSGRQKRQSDV
jgi:hypothetical protein